MLDKIWKELNTIWTNPESNRRNTLGKPITIVATSITIGSRIKVGIFGEPHPGLNFLKNIFLLSNRRSAVDRYTFRTPHFLMHSRCTDCSPVCTVISRTRVAQDWSTSFFPHKTLHPLRAMSHFLQHPCTGTPSPPCSVQRSEEHCHDPRLLQRGTSAELPPLTSTIHSNGNSVNTKLLSPTVHSVNQINVYAADTDWCYQFGWTNEEKRLAIPVDNGIMTMVEPEELELLVSVPTQAPGNGMQGSVLSFRTWEKRIHMTQ